MTFLTKRMAFLALLLPFMFCLGAAAKPLPISIKGKNVSPLYFGQTYREIARAWSLAAWPKDEPPFYLLPAGVVSRSEVEFLGQPFLTKFYFDKPSDEGRLLTVKLVHWEKGRTRNVLKAEDLFTKAILQLFGKQEPEVEQAVKWKTSTYNWTGVVFSKLYDDEGQTWYVSLWNPDQAGSLLAGLPLGVARSALEDKLNLEPYFEPGRLIPAIAGKSNISLDITCSPLKLRPLYIFAGYAPNAPLVGVTLYLPADGDNNWQTCGMEQLIREMELIYGPARRLANKRYQWREHGADLSLYQSDEGEWVLDYLSAPVSLQAPEADEKIPLPSREGNVAGWGGLLWNMSVNRALELYPHLDKASYSRAGGCGSFVAGDAAYAGITHQMRLFFDSKGLEKIEFNYESLAGGDAGRERPVFNKLLQEHGDYDWQFEDSNEKIFYWSRESGYLAFIKFKETVGVSWRIVFLRRGNHVVLPGN